jgi:hypothetical protein
MMSENRRKASPALIVISLLLLCGCGEPGNTATNKEMQPASRVVCPTSTPGTAVPQSAAKPPDVPEYPDARDLQVSTAELPDSLETPDMHSTDYHLTLKIVRFVTTDSPEKVLDFYRDSLIRAGWSLSAHPSAEDTLSFGWSVGDSLYEAYHNIPCAPTPETGLPAHGVDVTVKSTGEGTTAVELKQSYYPGH